MTDRSPFARRGSIYLITLVTVAAIVSMILIGVALRRASNNDSAIIELMSENSSSPFDASEYAIARIYDSSDWITEAQKGIAFSDFTLGDRAYSSSVVDADTLTTPTDSTTVYRVSVGSTHSSAQTNARFDLHYERFDYIGLLKNFELQHYWPLNEKSNPAKALDKKDNYDGTYLNPAIAGKGTNDEEGRVPVFTESSDHVRIPYGNDFKQSRAAISLWVKVTGSTLSFKGILGILWDSHSPTLSLGVWNSSLVAYISDNGSFSYSRFAISSGYTLSTDSWHHIVLNWGDPSLEIYVDGSKIALTNSPTGGIGTQLALFGGQNPLFIGAGFFPSSSSNPGQAGFNGSIAHVAMFNNTLSSSDVAKLATQKPDEIESDIIDGSWVRVFE